MEGGDGAAAERRVRRRHASIAITPPSTSALDSDHARVARRTAPWSGGGAGGQARRASFPRRGWSAPTMVMDHSWPRRRSPRSRTRWSRCAAPAPTFGTGRPAGRDRALLAAAASPGEAPAGMLGPPGASHADAALIPWASHWAAGISTAPRRGEPASSSPAHQLRRPHLAAGRSAGVWPAARRATPVHVSITRSTTRGCTL